MSRLHTAWEAALRMAFRPAPDNRFARLEQAISAADDARSERGRAEAQFTAAVDDLAERLQ